jgi:hypothetical protein
MNENRLRAGVLCVLAVLTGGLASAFAQTVDSHRLYEQRCAGCHAPHAGDFVRDNLVLSDDMLVGRKSGRDLQVVLESGHGKLTPNEIESIVTLMTNIQQSGRLFQEKCTICHDRAVNLARSELILKDGKLIGRYSKRDIEQFLYTHGRLSPDEVTKMVDVLKRQLTTMQIK